MDWVCSGCGRHFNWSVPCCPYCLYAATVTASGTQPTAHNSDYTAALRVLDECISTVGLVSLREFQAFTIKRLNAQKDEHCA